jgi:hypothetical protein
MARRRGIAESGKEEEGGVNYIIVLNHFTAVSISISR